jgi:exodeoxyribonuclease VII small subunit
MSENKTFEQKMARLEEIVKLLESGNVELDKSLALYEEGSKLATELTKSLNEAKVKIEEINSSSNK